MTNVNLACGGVYVTGKEWLNFDYISFDPAVRQANLLGRLPLSDNTVDLVYSSHFLEHIPRELAGDFVQECLRILKPGGILRLVVPDLEYLCRTFLYHRDKGEHDKADVVMLEILDQCVRRHSGGALGRYFQNLKVDSHTNSTKISFVRELTGEDLMLSSPPRRRSLRSILRRILALLERLWIRFIISLLPKAFRDQNVSLADVGELHHWIYDNYTLHQLLQASGFAAIERCSASSSLYPNFPFYALDLSADGLPRKGSDSLYIEAKKPL